MTASPRLLILSAPSGAGKTSLAQALARMVPDTVQSVSHTTRPARPGEVSGREYHFVDADTFRSMIEDGAFLEHAEVFGHLYGTSRETVLRRLGEGLNVVLDIDWQGAREVRRRLPGAVSVFVLPPSIDALEQRLRDRAQDDEAEIDRRMRAAEAEMSHRDEFDHQLVNDDFDTTLAALEGILTGRSPCAETPAGGEASPAA